MRMKLVLDEETLELDLTRLMLTESIALEEEWGLTVEALMSYVGVDRPPLKVVAALIWIAKVRAIAAAEGLSFPAAARQLPTAEFDLNLMAIRIDAEEEPEHPTPPATRTPATRTTRRTSAARPKKTG